MTNCPSTPKPFRADGGDISTGRLKEIADNPYGDEEKCWLAKRVLASLEVEPVAWTDADELRDVKNGGSGYLFAIGGEANKFADPHRQVMLYTAPPPPVVQEEMPKGLAGQIVSLLAHNIGDKFLAQKIWNACRTAMHLGAENTESRCTMQPASALDSLPLNADSRCSNSPVFRDGWVMVPAEPTEEMLAELCLVKGWTDRALNARYQAMLAAAPKPEA
ncbi:MULTISPECIES: hypothetical protein [Enterobacter cloacae complex]|uniref:hypothetical protein n=1 Tax=Enterobacter cloacae complex TaxID=354276 RepID=UPI00165EB4C5|nr:MULTISPECIES: hypothetical protein [Enterobacter cloacae complex]EHN6954126.1 hypothetical protein [Escherichia coli]EHN7313212.1 hypothetical protein [Escherichia coli]MCK6678490.1 hypothetical protein [Enterobacter asburiae]QNR09313.1 hypothetical protein G3T53_16180 [Enterobacter roggenkampii]UQQ40554.1 hypothetical protein MUY32_16255 [Enterobacter roggenkampii]